MGTLGKSDFAQQKENERLLSSVTELQRQSTELAKIFEVVQKSIGTLTENVLNLQRDVKQIKQKVG